MAIRLPKQSFIALAAVGWADGTFKKSESAALLRAATECGLDGGDLGEVERATKAAVALDAFDAGAMSEWERVVTYALASWLACLDGVQSSEESSTLATLGERLALAAPVRQRAAAAAFDVSVQPEAGRPEKYDFAMLVARLGERLPNVAKGA